VWDDRHTPEMDIPSKIEADCRSANGLPNEQSQVSKYHLRCELMAQSAVHDTMAHINEGKPLEETKSDIAAIFSQGPTLKFFSQLAEIAYLNPRMSASDLYQIALDRYRADPSITEIGGGAANYPSNASLPPSLGPSFPCPSPHDALGQLICGSPELSRLDLSYVQAYQALRQ
jgi:hypothetical protein